MNKNKKINVLLNGKLDNSSYLKFLSRAWEINPIPCDKYSGEKIDLILFIGGEDLNPAYYGENVGSKTRCNYDRDKYEKSYLFDNFRSTPKLGICRGSQVLTAWSGGKLFQHVEGHAIGSLHPIEMFGLGLNGNVYDITSTHHQMMNPYPLQKEDYEILAFSKYYLSNTYLDGSDHESILPKGFVEPEIVYYRKTNSLCIQGHPESQNCPENTKDMIIHSIKKVLNI